LCAVECRLDHAGIGLLQPTPRDLPSANLTPSIASLRLKLRLVRDLLSANLLAMGGDWHDLLRLARDLLSAKLPG
jgi:hypothetical protein